MAINVKTGFADGDLFTAESGQPANISRADLAADPAFEAIAVPTGGTTGQVLAKASGTDRDTEWVDQSGGGGSVNAGDVTGLAAFVEAYMANTIHVHAWNTGTPAWESADGSATDTDPDRFHLNISLNDAGATEPTGVRIGDLWFGVDA